jgi:hypothetical protein
LRSWIVVVGEYGIRSDKYLVFNGHAIVDGYAVLHLGVVADAYSVVDVDILAYDTVPPDLGVFPYLNIDPNLRIIADDDIIGNMCGFMNKDVFQPVILL